MSAADSDAERAGLTLESRDPSADVLVPCDRCERYVVPIMDRGDALCPHCKLVL